MLIELQHDRDLEQLLERSQTQPVVIFKHSTQCSRSADAWDELQEFVSNRPEVACGAVFVIEDRALSNLLEDRFGIRHESPQAIVVSQGSPVWHASHRAVTARALENAVGEKAQ